MRVEALCALALLGSLGMACEGADSRSFECADPAKIQELSGIHYEGVGCDEAIRSAESRLTTAYYRKACEQLAPREGVPATVKDAYVSRCDAAADDAGGSVLDIRVCCP